MFARYLLWFLMEIAIVGEKIRRRRMEVWVIGWMCEIVDDGIDDLPFKELGSS